MMSMKPVYTDTSPKSLLNKGSGYLTGYSHTLNPYVGCSFACSYCYVKQMPVALFRQASWGSWVDIKQGAASLFRKEYQRAAAKGAVTIFMSSSTDPYQPIEHKEQITRSLLEAMTEQPPDFLLIQTRSPLVSRDIDLLQQLGSKVRVSMTVETDLEEIRKHFSPYAPPIAARLRAIRELAEAGIAVQATIAPVLPSSERFPQLLNTLPLQHVCVDDYYMGDGSGGKRTERNGTAALYRELGLEDWYSKDAWRLVYERLREVFSDEQLRVSQQGFAP